MRLNELSIKMIKKYQKNKTSFGRCRHFPCCSNYGIECYQKFNFFKASFLTLYRILRCNPLSKKIYDPVPLSKKEKEEKKKRINELLNISDILLIYHKKLPLMKIEDDLIIIIEKSFYENNYNISSMIEKKYCIYDILERAEENAINDFFYRIEIWQKMIYKKKIDYDYSKNFIRKKTFEYIFSKKELKHSDEFINN